MKKKLLLLLAPVLFLPLSLVSCTEETDDGNVGKAASLVLDNASVTLVQGHDITVNITSGNGDYSVRSFDESVVTATVDGTAVTIHAVENSTLGEDDVLKTTVLVLDGRKKVARVEVLVARLWDLMVDAPAEGVDLFIGETCTVRILTGNGGYAISATEGAETYVEISEVAGQTFTLTGLLETGETPVQLTLTDSEGKRVTFPVKVNIVDLTLASNDAEFSAPDAEAQYIAIDKGNGGYKIEYRTGDNEPTETSAIAEASVSGNMITIEPKARGSVDVIVTDQKGSTETIAVTVNPYELELAGGASSITVKGFANTASVAIDRGNGGYELSALTDDNRKYIESATIDDNNNIVIKAKWLGTTTLKLSDEAGKTMDVPVTVAPVSAFIDSKYCFRIGIKEYIESHPEFDHQEQLTLEMVFYPTYSRGLQSFIGMEGLFLLRCNAGGDENRQFELATRIHKNWESVSGDKYDDPRFQSRQIMGSDRQNNGQWYHVAIVFDGTKESTREGYQMYINGVREDIVAQDEDYADVHPDKYLILSDAAGDNALMIGRSNNDGNRIGYCMVAQARMWTVARTAEQIKADLCTYYTPEEAKTKEGLAGYWIFSEGIQMDSFPNYGYAGEGLDAVVYDNDGSINPVSFPADQYRDVECPHSY